MANIPSTIADATSRADRASGRRRLKICVAAGFARRLPCGEEVVVHVGQRHCRLRVERRRDTGAVVLEDVPTSRPGDNDLAGILAQLGLDVGDHPEIELAGDHDINLIATRPHLGGL